MFFVSILRGINVSGQRKILMADLKALYESLGFTDVVTYIQSGNVIFKTTGKSAEAGLAVKIETAIEARYKFSVPVIIRSTEEIEQIIAANPFLKNQDVSPDKLHVTFLSRKPEKTLADGIALLNDSPDQFIIHGKEVYLHCPGSYGETKLSNTFFEKKLNVTATTRNWKTIGKLLELSVK